MRYIRANMSRKNAFFQTPLCIIVMVTVGTLVKGMTVRSGWHNSVLISICVMATLCAQAGVGPSSEQAIYYVAPDGNDAHPGTILQPLGTIQKAVSLLKPGDACMLRAGRYQEAVRIQGLKGHEAHPITIQAYPGETVILDGTIPIQTQWTPYKQGIYQTRIGRPPWQLFANDRSACPARWPNGNWDDGSIWNKSLSLAWPEKKTSGFGRHTNAELAQFDFSLKGAVIVVNSGSFRTYGSRVTDHEAGSDTLVYDTSDIPKREGYPANRHAYFLEGKLGFLDTENEWFYDAAQGKVFYRPQSGQHPRDLDMRAKARTYTLDVADASWLHIKGVTFFGTTFRFVNSRHCTVTDCRLRYPNYSGRMLGDLSPIEITHMTVPKESDPAHNTVRNCVIAYTDGPALEMNGVGNRVENNLIHDIDYSCTYRGGWTLNMIDAPDLIFRRNTVHTTGASEQFKAGRRNLIELNDLSRSGFLQNDGALIQISVKQQAGTVVRYNWVHDTVKIGIRFDNSNKPGSPWGEGCRAHHNVAWRTDRVFFKGDRHFIHNNLSFDSRLNDLVISSDIKTNGRNFNTVTRNNVAGTLSGSRTKPVDKFPVPGTVDHNWASDVEGRDIRTQLRDPDNLDFRPQASSELVDGGALLGESTFPYAGKAPDIGPYELGAPGYWIPGRQVANASRPIPPDGAVKVKRDADLMWLGAFRAKSHRVYWGPTRTTLKDGGLLRHNIFLPGPLQPNTTYYWRVDAVVGSKTVPGPIWSFTTGS